MSAGVKPALMDTGTLAALKGSIAKWKGVVAGTTNDKGTHNCPLCQLFHRMEGGVGCLRGGCPVAIRTGRENCLESPYEEYADEVEGDRRIEVLKTHAEAELAFLESLLPAGETP